MFLSPGFGSLQRTLQGMPIVPSIVPILADFGNFYKISGKMTEIGGELIQYLIINVLFYNSMTHFCYQKFPIEQNAAGVYPRHSNHYCICQHLGGRLIFDLYPYPKSAIRIGSPSETGTAISAHLPVAGVGAFICWRNHRE